MIREVLGALMTEHTPSAVAFQAAVPEGPLLRFGFEPGPGA